MKKLCVLMCLVPGLAFAHGELPVYVGAKISQRSMGFKTNFGNQMWAKNSLQFSVFGGYNFNEWLGAELDVFTTTNKKQNPTLNVGQTVLGVSNFTGLTTDVYNNKSQMTGATLKVTARHSVAKGFNLYGGLGVGLARLKNKANLVSLSGAPSTATQQANNNFDQSSTKFYPTVGVGADWRVVHNVGLRADVNWEGTSTFKKTFNVPAQNGLQYKAKQAFVYGVSVYYAM